MNIPFQADFFGVVWRRIWTRDSSPAMRVMCALIVLLFAPILLIALPWWIARAFKGPASPGSGPTGLELGDPQAPEPPTPDPHNPSYADRPRFEP